MTDSQKEKLEGLKTSMYLGTFLTSEEIPLEGAESGNYADVDSGKPNIDTERWIYDVEAKKFVKAVSVPASETSESVKVKYEANANTNAFTDALLTKLTNLPESGSIGEKGEKGDQGIQGIQGKQGVKGDTGAKGEDGKDGDTIKDSNSGTPLKIWTGTQEEYKLVLEKDPTTLYMVK